MLILIKISIIFQNYGIYSCICNFFFVTLRADLCTNVNMKERDSNMELLRIIAMWMITLHHFLANTGMHYSGIVGRAPLAEGYEVATMINGLVYIGVNCFILISGYYGIRFKLRGLFNLWLICAFYAICSPILRYYLYGMPLDLKQTIHDAIFCFSYTPNWFIICYVYLYFLAPLLNYAREVMNKRQYLYVLALMTVLTLYFGYYRHGALWNPDGYTLGQFIYMYIVGGYIRKFVRIEKKSCGEGLFGIYLASCLLWGVLTIVQFKNGGLGHWQPITYNNPLTLIASIAFFMMMTTINIRSKFVNKVAKSVLGVVMLAIPYRPISDYLLTLLPDGLYMPIVVAVIGTTLFFVAVIAFDQIRILLGTPLLMLWDKVEETVTNRLKKI